MIECKNPKNADGPTMNENKINENEVEKLSYLNLDQKKLKKY